MGIEADADFLLVQKMHMGDERAFESFVAKYYPVILKYCQINIRDRGYAEDMTQETFTRFFRTFEQYKHYGKAVQNIPSSARCSFCRIGRVWRRGCSSGFPWLRLWLR